MKVRLLLLTNWWGAHSQRRRREPVRRVRYWSLRTYIAVDVQCCVIARVTYPHLCRCLTLLVATVALYIACCGVYCTYARTSYVGCYVCTYLRRGSPRVKQCAVSNSNHIYLYLYLQTIASRKGAVHTKTPSVESSNYKNILVDAKTTPRNPVPLARVSVQALRQTSPFRHPNYACTISNLYLQNSKFKPELIA